MVQTISNVKAIATKSLNEHNGKYSGATSDESSQCVAADAGVPSETLAKTRFVVAFAASAALKAVQV
jgi:hypothetical protein